MNYTIKIWELNKGQEKIIDCKTFPSRWEAEAFIVDHKAEIKHYKMPKDKLHFTMES